VLRAMRGYWWSSVGPFIKTRIKPVITMALHAETRMTQSSADVIVIGLGGHGSAAAAHLASRGIRVIGIEQFPPAHSKGSSHGHSRIIRQAYFEDPRYVPLLKRSFELWRQLQKDSGTQLLCMTGGLMIGDPSTSVIRGTLASVRKHNLQHKILTSAQIHHMYPVFNPRPNEIGVLEEEAGYLIPEACITAHVEQASKFGAQLYFETKAYHWSVDADGKVTVITDKGKFVSDHLILSVGAWAQQMYAGSLRLPLKVERRVLYWFEPKQDAQSFSRIPVYIWDTGRQGENFYGFPTQPGVPGVKVAYHLMDPKDRDQSVCTADTVQRSVSDTETIRIRDVLADRMPALPGTITSTATCMYVIACPATTTPMALSSSVVCIVAALIAVRKV
jgi:sarcosine oxidase